MEKKYFVMAINDAEGCPSGFYDTILSPAFDKNIEKQDYGYYVWYAGPKRYKGQIKIPYEHLTLISKQYYRYSVRRGSKYFYVIDKRFKECLEFLRHSFIQIIPISYVNKAGKMWSNEDFFVAVPQKFFKEQCIDKKISTRSENTDLIKFKEDWDYDLFDVKDIPSSQASLFCSEKAKNIFESNSVKCIKYIDINDINPPDSHEPTFRPVMFYDPV